MPFPPLILASHNTGKLAELRQALKDLWPGVIHGAGELGLAVPAETAGSFKGNAVLKAEAACLATGGWALADDAGLCVDALDGRPGVDSASYGGPATLLKDMQALTDPDRRASFVCVLALARPGKDTLTFTGTCAGHILTAMRGTNGFGFDPVFVPRGEKRSFGEMSVEEKARMSHRGQAMGAFIRWVKDHNKIVG